MSRLRSKAGVVPDGPGGLICQQQRKPRRLSLNTLESHRGDMKRSTNAPDVTQYSRQVSRVKMFSGLYANAGK